MPRIHARRYHGHQGTVDVGVRHGVYETLRFCYFGKFSLL